MTKPKVILIGGCPGAGKTTLGRAVAARLGYVSLTIDDLLGAARAITTQDTHPGLHVMNKPNCARYFTNSPVEKLIADAALQHEAIWPAVEKTIRNHATWGTPIVIDGWHLRPKWIQSLNQGGVSAHWLVIAPDVLEARERKNTEFFAISDDPEQMLNRFIARSLWHNDLIDMQAQSTGNQILRQHGRQAVGELCERLESHLYRS